MKKSILALIMTVTIMSSLFAGTEIDKNFHQKYDVKEGASLNLKHGDGNVEITTWAKDIVDIDIVYRATFTGMSRIDPKDFEAEFEKRGDHITVIGHEPRVMGIGSHRVYEYKYTIKAPAYVSLNIRGIDGNVHVDSRNSNIKVHSVDGNIDIDDVVADLVDVESIDGNLRLEQIDADIKAETVDGNISIQDVTKSRCRCKSIDGNITVNGGSGNFEASTVDGNIKLFDLYVDEIDAHTSDGRIELEVKDSNAPEITLKSGDGNVRVTLANGTSVKLNVNTGDGSIRTDLSPVSDLDTDDDLFRGAINGGAGFLNIRTGDGSVSIVEK